MSNEVPVKNAPESVTLKGNNVESGTVSARDLSEIVAKAVAEALKVAIPAAAVGINEAQRIASEKTTAMKIREVMRKTKRCPVCMQPETACGGPFAKDEAGNDIAQKNADGSLKYQPELNHTREFVAPKDESLRRRYDGQRVNGICYHSQAQGHLIWIPKKSDIMTELNKFERNERDLLQQRMAEGQGAGFVGPQGQAFHHGNPNAIGWR